MLEQTKNVEHQNEISIKELLSVIWRYKILVLGSIFCCSMASIVYAVYLPNTYKSEVLLAPSLEQKMPGISGQLGGLAALAGVSVGNSGGVDKTALALEILKSREFLGNFINKYNLLVPLMAVKRWELSTNSFVYDDDVYNVDRKEWVRNVNPPRKAEPSIQEAYFEFRKIFSVSQDVDTGMVKVSIEYFSPALAQEWVTRLVAEINYEMRQRDIQEAKQSIDYVQGKILETTIADVKVALFSLIEEQTKTLMLANVREEYAFKTVDPAVVPEEKSGPKRAVIVVLVAFFSAFMSSISIVVWHYSNKKNSSKQTA